MKKAGFTLSILAILFSAFTGVGEPRFDHSAWDKLLNKYVSPEGNVNYDGFKADRVDLNAYLKRLSENPPTDDWSKNQAMAYWINAYNAFTVDLILKNYPLKSIMNINNGKAWDLPFIEIGGKKYSLNNIEHDILRKKYKDERIHFAVNCASVSCPKLNNNAYFSSDLEKQLETATKRFINNSEKNKIGENTVEISKLFDWYKEDFMEYGSVLAYINHYVKEQVSPDAKITYKEYNWNLNK